MKHVLTAIALLTITCKLNAQNVGIGVPAPQAKLHVNGNMMIDSAYYLEFGGRVVKEANAGKMGYQVFTPGALDIVGAGTGSRKVKIWNEAGATFAGKIHIESGKLTNGKTGETNHLLPVGTASVQGGGGKQSGTDNVSTSWVDDHYVIEMGEGVQGMQTSITVNSASPRFATVINGTPTALWVFVWNLSGEKVQNAFHIVMFKP